jgi:hypothetical protein
VGPSPGAAAAAPAPQGAPEPVRRRSGAGRQGVGGERQDPVERHHRRRHVGPVERAARRPGGADQQLEALLDRRADLALDPGALLGDGLVGQRRPRRGEPVRRGTSHTSANWMIERKRTA